MNKTIRTKLIAMLLAAVMAVGLAACGSQSAGSPGAGAPGIADTGELPEVNALPGIPRGDKNKNKLDPDHAQTIRRDRDRHQVRQVAHQA